ncbi:MAG: choice-of-anchor D domain-containing protein, partial [Bacteroidota bacterium]
INANPVGLRSVVLDSVTAVNVRLAGIDPVTVADILGRSKVKIDVTPIDIGRDAHGMLTIRDRTGKVWSVPYDYRAERLDIDSAQIRFGKVTVDQPESVTITCINPIFQDITVSAATFTPGLPGFSVVSTTPALPAVLKPGAVLTVRVAIDPKILQKSYGDILHLKLDCRDITISVSATATQPMVLVNDLDFGTMSAGGPVKSMTLSICNTADGVLKLLKQDTTGGPEILSWGDPSFTVSVAAIDSLQGKRLNLGECVRLTVSFNPRAAGSYATTARAWTNSRINKDTSYWRAVVVNGPSGVEDGAVTGHAGYLLEGIVPNPTGGKGEITYRLGASGSVSVTIYNAAGEQVAQLADEPQSAGEHRLTWDASVLPTGLYYCRIRSGGWSAAEAIVVAR